MLISQLQERRNQLMVDAAAIIRSESPTAEQRTAADKMLADAADLEKRAGQLKAIEQHEAEQRAFVPAGRPEVSSTVELRKRANAALRTLDTRGRFAAEYRDIFTTSASGAATIPQLFNPELITALRAFAPMLDILDNRVTDKNGAPMKMSLVNYTGTILPVVAEGTVFPEIDPAFTSQISSVDKLGGMVKLSHEELNDSEFDLGGFLMQQWANMYSRSLEHYTTLGNGGNIAPLLSVATLGATTAVAGTIAYPDVAATYGSLSQAYQRNASWMMSTPTRADLIGLVATTGIPIFNTNPQSAPFSEIFGRPVIINDSLPAVATGNDPILFGDFKSAYLLRTDGPTTMTRLDERFAETDEVGFIIRTRVGGITKNAGVSPLVSLAVK